MLKQWKDEATATLKAARKEELDRKTNQQGLVKSMRDEISGLGETFVAGSGELATLAKTKTTIVDKTVSATDAH